MGQKISQKVRDNIIRIVTFVVLIGGWEYFGGFANPLLVAVPSDILIGGWELLLSGELGVALSESMTALVVGYVIATVIGIFVGVLMGGSRTAEVALDPYVNSLYSMPLVAMVPLLMLWVGIGFESKVIIVALFSVFPIIINTLAGVRNVDRHYLDIGLAFNASRWVVFTKIVAPYAVPYIASGLRLAVSRAIIAVVVAEFLTAIAGLGGLIINYSNNFQTAKAFVPVIVLAILGNILTFAVRRVELYLGRWKGASE